MNTKIALSGLSIIAALTLASGATFAYFSDTATSTVNAFSTGTLNLQLTDSTETDQDNVTASFGDTNMAPGDCSGTQTLTLKNAGTVAADHVDITATNSNATLAALLKINSITYNGNPVIIADSNTNSITDLADLAAAGILDVTAPAANGGTVNLVMDVCLDTTATTAVQGQTNNLSLSVLLTQEP